MAQKSEVPEEVKAAAVAAAEREETKKAAATPEKMTVLEATAKANYVAYGSERHERILSAAYGKLTRKKAEQIIKEREADPHLWPWEKYQQAQDFLKALDSIPPITASKPHWKRTEVG